MGLLSVKEVSQRIRASEMTIRRKIKAGQIPHRRLGSRIFFTEQDVETYINAGLVPMRSKVSEAQQGVSNG